MAVCNPLANPPAPSGTIAWTQSGKQLTPNIQRAAKAIADDLSVPIGTIVRQWVDGVPCVFFVSCHPFTVNPDGSSTPGAYHGVEVRYPTTEAMMPPKYNGAPQTTDWKLVGLSAGAIALVVAGFLFVLKTDGRKRYAMGNPLNDGWYIRVERRAGHPVAYGPFASKEAAVRASFFARSPQELDDLVRAGGPRGGWAVYMEHGLNLYTDDEIKALPLYPEEYGYKSYTFKPATALRMHTGWRRYDEDLREDIFNRFDRSR